MAFSIVEGDITKMRTEAIVNAANTELEPGGGVCGAIYKAAGYDALKKATDQLGSIETGQAVYTEGFNLPASYIIHTAGPIYMDGTRGERDQLARAYRNSLALAKELGICSIAFPLLSAGIYGYPRKEALQVCIEEAEKHLSGHDMDIYLTVLDREELVNDPAIYPLVKNYL